MKRLLASPSNALGVGLAIAIAILLLWVAAGSVDLVGLASIVLRVVHVLAAMIWIGMIWFVNFIQLVAVQQADDQARGPLLRLIVPRVTNTFLHASGLTVLSGALLLPSTGYVLDRWIFSSAVYVSTPRALMLWSGAAAGFAMLIIAFAVIRPGLRIILGEVPGDVETVARARARVAAFARINLILVVPVTFVMVAAAHS